MNKLNQFILKYLLCAFPAVLIMFVWGFFENQQEVLNTSGPCIAIIWEILAWHLMIWFLMLIYALCMLILSSRFRDSLLAKLARIKERDEREIHIIGKSGRFTFFSTLALLVFLLFFSTINISITKLPIEKSVNGKQRELSIGLSFRILEETNTNEDQGKDIIFSTQSSPLSKQSILILLIMWHVGSFYFSTRKMMRE